MRTQEHLYRQDEYFNLESGSALPGFQLKYTTLGELNPEKSNVVWVCHALTGSSNFVDWWGALFEEEGPFDPREYFIVCVNTLGGCYGSTGPLSVNPESSTPFFHDFPTITNWDIVRSFDLLRTHLEIEKIHTLIGGSLGGQQALTWAIYNPEVCINLIPIACNAFHSPWGIAINESQRMAIEADQTWQMRNANAGSNGLKAARAISMTTFRSFEAFQLQGEKTNRLDQYRAASYQRYQGEKLAKRFDAFSYWTLTKVMDNHQVGRKFRSPEDALRKIRAKTLVIGIDSDLLFPVSEQKFIYNYIPNAQLEIIQSPYGHDAFLIELETLKVIIHNFLKFKFVYDE